MIRWTGLAPWELDLRRHTLTSARAVRVECEGPVNPEGSALLTCVEVWGSGAFGESIIYPKPQNTNPFPPKETELLGAKHCIREGALLT